MLTGTPNTLTIKWNKTQAFPAAQRMILRGGKGGALTTVPEDASSTDGYYNLGTMVTFTAKPKTGCTVSDMVFNGTSTSTNPLVLQVTVPVNVVAEFH